MATFKLLEKQRDLNSVSYALLVFFLLFFLPSFSNAAPTYLGSGTSGDPYRIDTCLELQDMNYHLGDPNVYFTLDANIDCSETKDWVVGPGTTKLRGFDPIGKYTPTGAPYGLTFQGHFDGNNMEIRNLMIWGDVNQHNGLFGYVYGAKISNVGIVDVNIWSCMGRSGALIGTMKENTDVNNVWVLGGTIFDSHYVGGLIGIASPFGTDRSDVNQVFVKDLNVFAFRSADYSPTCTGDPGCAQCSADHVGGIIGTANEVNFWHVYTTASVTGVNGFLTDNNGAFVGDCGIDCSDITVTESYWNPTDSITTLAADYAGVQVATQSTQANMKKAATYVNWNFVDVWGIIEDGNTPYFLGMPYGATGGGGGGGGPAGSGSSSDPYILTTCAELQDMDLNLNNTEVYYELGNNVDCSGIDFTPVGESVNQFKGHFDGNHYEISNLTINTNALGAGLYGYTDEATIKNVGFLNPNITNIGNRTGVLIGSIANTTDVNNVWVLGGQVTGTGWVGGLVGINYGDLNQVFTKDLNVRTTTAQDSVGGISGVNFGTIWHAYSTAKIINGGANSGGISGFVSESGTETQSYWNITDSGVADNSQGTVITAAQQKKEGSYIAWNFDDIWGIWEDLNTPYFYAMPYPDYRHDLFDFNFVKIDNDYFTPPIKTYSSNFDGNLTIYFTVFNTDNNRFTLDLNYFNYSDTNAILVKDLNLTSGVCTDQKWDDVPSTCHWDFDISSIADGNYFLRARLFTDLNFFDLDTVQSFLVANDVNIVINTPIDEETGIAIDTVSKYTWVVRIYDSTGMRYYPGQRDANGFAGPIGDQITVSIDTNDSTAFYARQYNLQFNTGTSTYTLQPYLVKQSVSGNFIFNVTNIATAAPISDVEIQIYGFVPGLGTPALQTIITDSAGLATIPLRLNSPYTVKFYYLGSLVHTASITPTTGSLYYQVQLNISSAVPPTPDYGALQAFFYPTTGFLMQKSNGSVDINVSVSLLVKTLQRMQVQVFDTNGCRFDNNFFTGPWTDGNTIVMASIDLNNGIAINIRTGLPCEFNDIFSVFAIIDANSTDGNHYQARSINWQLVTDGNYKYNLMYLLPNLASAINGENGKLATTFIALLVLITAVSAVGAVTGGEPIMAAMLTLGILGFFMMIGFVDFLPFAFICIATFFGTMYMWGRFG